MAVNTANKKKNQRRLSVSRKSRNPKFDGKYSVRPIGTPQFAVASGNTALLSLQQVCVVWRSFLALDALLSTI
jgi:hypothetical protein